VVPGYGAAIGNGGTGYTYASPNTVPSWIGTSTGTGTLSVEQSGSIEIQGENADIKMNGKSMKAWMEKVEERLNILTPNPELEKDWDDLRRLGERYRALEKKCREKAQMWEALKKVQPKQP
jgi:flagellar motility protein MotE (MotC chaperone)